jgi:hypothetical protein
MGILRTWEEAGGWLQTISGQAGQEKEKITYRRMWKNAPGAS